MRQFRPSITVYLTGGAILLILLMVGLTVFALHLQGRIDAAVTVTREEVVPDLLDDQRIAVEVQRMLVFGERVLRATDEDARRRAAMAAAALAHDPKVFQAPEMRHLIAEVAEDIRRLGGLAREARQRDAAARRAVGLAFAALSEETDGATRAIALKALAADDASLLAEMPLQALEEKTAGRLSEALAHQAAAQAARQSADTAWARTAERLERARDLLMTRARMATLDQLAAVQEHSRALRRTFIVGVLVALSLAAAFVYAGHRLITRPLVRGVEDLRLGRAPDPAKRQSVLRIRELYTVDTAAERLSKLLARVRLRETRLRLALEGGNHGLWDADVRSGRVETSGRIEQALGCSRGAWPGTLARWRLRVHPADRPRMTAALRAHLRGDAVFYHADYRVRTEAGGWLWISDRGQVVERDAAGRPLRAIGTHTDISARKAIEADLKRSNDDLERFAYIASHDLKEPLRMIVSYLNLLKNRYGGRLGAEADEFIDYAVSGGRRLHRMIDDLLDYARIDRTATPVPVDLRACLDEALDILRPVIESRGAAITSDPLPVVPGLPGQLTRLFVNLVSNAIKYAAADKPPVIHVGAVRQGAVWVLSVADNGVGIDPAYHERIFDVFQRLNVRDLDDYGSGIGLAICRRIVQAHGGTIAVDSRPGRGAVFTLTLPAEDRAGDPAEGAAEGDTGTALRAPAAGDGARHVGRIG